MEDGFQKPNPWGMNPWSVLLALQTAHQAVDGHDDDDEEDEEEDSAEGNDEDCAEDSEDDSAEDSDNDSEEDIVSALLALASLGRYL